MQRRTEYESEALAHISMVELAGPHAVAPTSDYAPTLPFQREDLTDKVVRIAPIEDDTVPFSYEPSEPYALIEIREVIPMPAKALRASANLVAGDPVDEPSEPAVAPSRRSEPFIAVALLAGALAMGVGLSFLVAAFAR